MLTELRRAIVAGDLPPGQQIRQDALAERFGVSRVPLREALKILEGEGQVTYLPHRGYFVAELDVADLREVYLLRDLLESEAVRQAVPRLTAEDLSRIEAAADDVEQGADAQDLLEMTAANRRFHVLVIDAAGLPRLARLTRILWDATDAYRSLYYADPDHRQAVAQEHQAVISALRDQDTERAVILLAEHRRHAVTAVTDALAARG